MRWNHNKRRKVLDPTELVDYREVRNGPKKRESWQEYQQPMMVHSGNDFAMHIKMMDITTGNDRHMRNHYRGTHMLRLSKEDQRAKDYDAMRLAKIQLETLMHDHITEMLREETVN